MVLVVRKQSLRQGGDGVMAPEYRGLMMMVTERSGTYLSVSLG